MKKSLKKTLASGYEKEMDFKDQRSATMEKAGIVSTPAAPKKRHPVILALSLSFGIPVALMGAIVIGVVVTNRRNTYSFSAKKFDFTLEEKEAVASQSFAPLNDVSYPSSEQSETSVSDSYRNAVDSFALKLYQSLDETNVNSCYSPLGLYAGLDILSAGASDSASLALDSSLGLNKASRKSEWASMYKGDYFETKTGSTQMHNGFFLTNEYGMEISDSFLADLTSRYVEAYSLSFHDDDDVSKMLAWVDSKVKAAGFFGKDSLQIFPKTDAENINVFYLFNTIYFQEKWESRFDGDDSYQADFHQADGSTIQADYISHVTNTYLHEYDDYVSCLDYYSSGTSIEYFVPKKTTDSIFTILDGKDFLDEEPLSEKQYIKLSVPKFSYDVTTDFSSVLDDIGLSVLSDPKKKPLNGVLKSNPDDYSVYLGFAKQRNVVSFTEEGTTIKTGTVFAGLGTGSAGPGPDGYEVNLNQPFIYVIRDNNGLPLYIGQCSSPK